MGSGGVEVKSSMEAMLDSLMRRDEKPRDVPPALPPRPPSRGRLPSAKRSLPPLRFGSSEENLVLDPSLLVENQADVFVVEEEKEKGEEKEKEEVPAMEVDVDVIAEKEKEEEEVDISRGLRAEEELKEKEEEVAALRQQILRFETRCSDYEARIKCLQDQLSQQQQQQQQQQQPQLQPQSVCIQVRRERGMNGHDYNDPGQGNRQRRQPSEDAKTNPVGQLMSEFENKKRSFEEEAKVLSQWRPGQAGSCSNPVEDLMKLKLQFTAWKRDFKVRLQDTRGSLEKVVGKSRMNCWTGMKWKK